ncbi:MAG: MFS transporter, partial [Acidimicrobiia bacterium]|nr:MFS transporter [Acidimicrobiia bacterium]
MATDTTKAGIPGPTATASERALIDSAQGWMVVGATFLATFVVFGVAYSFGSFFESMADEFDTGKGATALMFSITTALYFFLGLITGRVTDRVGPRPVMAFGAVSLGVGLLATSRVNSIWAGYLTYGIGVGMAVACCYVPMVSTVGAWFVRRRTAAMGVSVAGIGFGTLVMAPAAASLIDRWGWRDTYVFLGVAGAALLLVGSLAARRPPRSATEESPDLGAVIRDRRFLVLYGASLLLTVTLFVPFVFIEQY